MKMLAFVVILLFVCWPDRRPVTAFIMWSIAAAAFWWALLR
jgi:hypothetical protein